MEQPKKPDASIDGKIRVSAFLNQVLEQKVVWGLRNDVGMATWKYDESDETVIPFWSDKEKALLCARDNFPDYSPFDMKIGDFTGHVLPQLHKQGILVGINLSEKMGGIDLPAQDLIAEIEGAGQ